MNEYYVLAHDDRDDLETVCEYDLANFNATTFWDGRSYEGVIPGNVRLWIGEGKPADYLANPISWPIVSDRFWRLIEPLVNKDCQLFRPPLYRMADKTPAEGYVLMHVTRCVEAVKHDNGADAFIPDLHLDKTRIPADAHLFRLAESSTVIIVSDSLVDCIRGKGLTGVALIHAELD